MQFQDIHTPVHTSFKEHTIHVILGPEAELILCFRVWICPIWSSEYLNSLIKKLNNNKKFYVLVFNLEYYTILPILVVVEYNFNNMKLYALGSKKL